MCSVWIFHFFLPVVLYAMHPKNTEINHSRCLLVTFFHSILHHQLWPKSHCAMMDALINWGEFVGKKETTLFVIRFILFIKIFRKLWKISHHGHNSHPCKFSFFFSFLKLCESFWWKKTIPFSVQLNKNQINDQRRMMVNRIWVWIWMKWSTTKYIIQTENSLWEHMKYGLGPENRNGATETN